MYTTNPNIMSQCTINLLNIYNVAASQMQIGVTSALIHASFWKAKVSVLLNKSKKVNYASMPTELQSFALR